jgi:hypothetical protein
MYWDKARLNLQRYWFYNLLISFEKELQFFL